MKKKIIYPIIWLGCLLMVYLLIYYPKFVGLGDNSDFGRIMEPIGLKVDVDKKYFYAQRTFEYGREWNDLGEYLAFVNHPQVEVDHQYHSTQFILVKVAGYINGFYQYMRHGFIDTFDIWTLAILYIGIFSLAVTVFIRSIPLKYTLTKVLIAMLFIWIFFDKGYILYFNSFYGEALILVSFLLYVASIGVILKEERAHGIWFFLSFIAGGLFIGAKVANIPLGILMLLYGFLLYWKKKDKSTRFIIVLGSGCLLLTSLYFYTTIPEWLNRYNRYHAVFYGILKDSPHPKEDLKDLGIDEAYYTLQDTHAYMDHKGYDIHSKAFSEDVYDKATPFRVSVYYLTHPKRLWDKMHILARSSTIIRPPYLGNYLKEDSEEALLFDRRWSSWEKLRKMTYSYALFILVLISLLYSVTSVINYIQNTREWNTILVLVFRIMLLLFAASQFILPVIGNGEADLVKHMFLFNMIFDMMIVLMVIDIIRWLESGYYKLSLGLFVGFVSILIIVNINAYNRPHKIITMGHYNNKPIRWEVLHKTGNQYLIAAKDIVTYKIFDQDVNIWNTSKLRKWLNSDQKTGFLYDFTEEEKQRIRQVRKKTIVAPLYKEQFSMGVKSLFWYPIPGGLKQNYYEAYGNFNVEKVFLLDIRAYEKYSFTKKKESMYWLRTPYSNRDMVRIVDTDGFVYHKEANQKSIGVVPCMVISVTE